LKILVTIEDHLTLGADGHFYVHGPAHYSAWTELLEVFDEVVLLARVAKGDGQTRGNKRVDGMAIHVEPTLDYTGPWQALQKLPALKAQVRRVVASCDAYLLRVPGLVSRLVWKEVKSLGRPFGAEVLGDPWDAMSPGSMPGPFRPLYRRIATRDMKKVCASATCTLYWTREVLQKRYPPGAAKTFVSPRVILEQGFATLAEMAERSRRIQELRNSGADHGRELCIGYLGTFAQLYKGPDTLLQALSRCDQRGLNFKIILAGEGKYRQPMEALAQNLGIRERTVFLGQLEAGNAVTEFLDSLDLFVMPSRQEGLCRAFVEAMARGCPCIGSKAGAVELLTDEELVPANDPQVLAEKILAVAADLGRMQAMTVRNLQKARQFRPDLLRDVRCAFYKALKTCSQSKQLVVEAGAAPQSC
jgi:glycosyltransferase involved in cell wall biosynthesis